MWRLLVQSMLVITAFIGFGILVAYGLSAAASWGGVPFGVDGIKVAFWGAQASLLMVVIVGALMTETTS